MKKSHICILGFLVLVLMALAAWFSRSFLLQNNVVFLLNQRQFAAAGEVLQKLEKTNKSPLKTQFLRTKTSTLSGNYKLAAELHTSGAVAKAYPESLYWRALSEYQLGEAEAASQTAKAFLHSGKSLPHGAIDIAKALAGERIILDVPKSDVAPFRMLFPVEQAVYTGLAASQQMEIGRLDTAALLFKNAFIMGNRNHQLLYQACKVSALVGFFGDGQMFFDYSKNGSINPLFEDFEKAYRAYNIASLTLHSGDLAQGGRKIDIARALAWTANMHLKEDPDKHSTRVLAIINELVKEYPYDVVLQVQKAAIHSQLGEKDAALSIYNHLFQKFPNYTVLVRKAGVEGISENELSSRSNDFMKNLSSVAPVPLEEHRSSGGAAKASFYALAPGKSIRATLNVEERGSYIIMLVARSSKVGETWPLVKMFVDGKFTGVAYVFRKSWDCYSLTVPLESGFHSLELIHDKNMVAVAGKTENNLLNVRAVYMALTGVADVQY